MENKITFIEIVETLEKHRESKDIRELLEKIYNFKRSDLISLSTDLFSIAYAISITNLEDFKEFKDKLEDELEMEKLNAN